MSDHQHRVDKSISQTNYFEKGAALTCPDSKYVWILQRNLSLCIFSKLVHREFLWKNWFLHHRCWCMNLTNLAFLIGV
jgi:hypothetical protein